MKFILVCKALIDHTLAETEAVIGACEMIYMHNVKGSTDLSEGM